MQAALFTWELEKVGEVGNLAQISHHEVGKCTWVASGKINVCASFELSGLIELGFWLFSKHMKVTKSQVTFRELPLFPFGPSAPGLCSTYSPDTEDLHSQCGGLVKSSMISKKEIPEQDIINQVVLQFGEPYGMELKWTSLGRMLWAIQLCMTLGFGAESLNWNSSLATFQLHKLK